MHIREAQTEDATQLAELMMAFAMPYRAVHLPAGLVADRLNTSRSVELALVAEDDTGLVGFVCVRIVPQMSDDRPYAEVTDLFVAEHARRKGYGRSLLAAAEERARAAGADALVLITGFDNDDAQRVYRSAGFADWALAMKKELLQP